MICPYCEVDSNQTEDCSFCGADLTKNRPKRRGELSELDANLPQPVLTTYHTLDLLVLLRFLRQERSKSYKRSHTLRKTVESLEIDLGTDALKEAHKDYESLTRRQRVIENILIDRLGYLPRQITDKLIIQYQAKVDTFTNTKSASS